MLLGGLQKTTLIDFPGRVAATVFTVGCNFRCPFCHNKDLVTKDLFERSGTQPLKEKDFFAFLEKRKKILDGVCITGGEPSINQDLPQFCQKIKDLGLEVKVDTNGSNPKMLKKLIDKKLVNFIAMDIKTSFDEYQKAVDVGYKIKNIKSSIKLILESGLEYEFRTTVVPGIHNKKTMIKLARQLKQEADKSADGSAKKINYILQQFQPKNCLKSKYLKVKPYTNQEMKDILKSVQKILAKTKLRKED